MSLQDWLSNGWLRPHKTSREEIENLFKIIVRDLNDVKQAISLDWQFGIAYNAALKLSTIPLYASGFRPGHTLQHHRSIESLKLTLGSDWTDITDYLQSCRKKRNILECGEVGRVSEKDVKQLLEVVQKLSKAVKSWLKQNYPNLLP